jgi:hypothetical protein
MHNLAYSTHLLDCQRPTFVVSMKIPFLSLIWSSVEGLFVLGCRPVSADNRVSAQRSQYPTLPTDHQQFHGWKLTVKFMTHGFEPPVTEARCRSTWCTRNVWPQSLVVLLAHLEVSAAKQTRPRISVNYVLQDNCMARMYSELGLMWLSIDPGWCKVSV